MNVSLNRSYYSSSIDSFLAEDTHTIIGTLTMADTFSQRQTQRVAWEKQIGILKESLGGLNGHIFFEFSIPRMGLRADVILLVKGFIFVIEFKVGSRVFLSADLDQVWDYALDLVNFHVPSHHLETLPILIATEASTKSQLFTLQSSKHQDKLFYPICINHHLLRAAIDAALEISEGLI